MEGIIILGPEQNCLESLNITKKINNKKRQILLCDKYIFIKKINNNKKKVLLVGKLFFFSSNNNKLVDPINNLKYPHLKSLFNNLYGIVLLDGKITKKNKIVID